MSNKIEWPSRMSLPLSKEERNIIIDLKAVLQKQDRTLKDFVWENVLEGIKREGLLPLAEKAKKK
jgi:hypothetical protein